MKIEVKSGSIHIVGNATRDAEARFTQSGKSLVSFSLADGRNENVEYCKCTVWEGSMNYDDALSVRKGDKVLVDGTVNTREYTDNYGEVKTSRDINVEWLDVRHKAEIRQQSIVPEELSEDVLPF